MKVARVIKLLVRKRNRIISVVMQIYRKWTLALSIAWIRLLAVILNGIDPKTAGCISETEIAGEPDRNTLTVNCMGAVEPDGKEHYQRDLSPVADILQAADVSLAIAAGEADSALNRLLCENGIALLPSDSTINSRIYRTAVGSVGILSFERYQQGKPETPDKVQIMRSILMLRRKKADYIIAYVHGGAGDSSENYGGSLLYKILSQMGVDYIVGVVPDRRDSGSTYLKPDGSIARSVYSLGTFLTGDREKSPKRVIIRLKLGIYQGKLQLAEETYFPLYHLEDAGLVSLLERQTCLLPTDQVKKYRAEIEDEMRRIRPADRVLTIGRIMQLTGVQLPERYRYLADFSAGKICGRYSEVMPGDVFFFREPYQDPNDAGSPGPWRRLVTAGAAVNKGAMLLFTFRPLPFSCVSVMCDSVSEAYIAVCAHIRRQCDIKTIAITGSIGKTSTKDMLAEVMRMRYNTVKSERNANVQVAIGENLQRINSACQVFIQEVGGGRRGGASRNSRMVLPEVSVVTNIGDAHIGNFGSKEKLMENKLQIVEGMPADGILYLNADDALLSQVRPSRTTVFYAVHNRDADYYVENLTTSGGHCAFDIVHGESRTPVKLHVLGEYNVLNAVCCFAIGRQFGIPEADIAAGLSHFQPTGIRQNLMEVCGRKLFMDCYNASSDSVKSALEILSQIHIEPGKKRIAVIGDITGTGAMSEEIHTDIGHIIPNYPVDHVLLYGTEVKHTYEVLKDSGIHVMHILKREELNQMLRKLVNPGDVAMFKGSSKMLLEYSVDMVFGTRLTDQRLQDEREYKRVQNGSVLYDLYANYGTAEKYAPQRSGERRIHIASRVGGIEIVNMGRALQGRNIAEVDLPDSIRHISAEAFRRCTQLTVVRLPKRLKYIGNRAFRDCRSLREVVIPENVMHIGTGAFAGCSGLRKVTLPASVVQIGKDAFAGCENCQFICPPGSYAEQYLQDAGLGS